MTQYSIALWGGDGIGPEVLNEAQLCLNQAGLRVKWEHIEWTTRAGVPDDFLKQLEAKKFDAIFLGALGDPMYAPDSVSLRPLLEMRKTWELYACVRRARLFEGVKSPLADPGNIDIVVVRENTEGEYNDSGGRTAIGTKHEIATQVNLFTRRGVERIIRYAFKLALKRSHKLTLVVKDNAQRFTNTMMVDVFFEIAREYPSVSVDRQLVDACAMNLVRNPSEYDVIVTTNLFGDILSDLLAGIVGGMGLAPSSNIGDITSNPALFEPVHGSALDIAGQEIANPIAAILSGAEMASWLGEDAVAQTIYEAVEEHLKEYTGCVNTRKIGQAIADRCLKYNKAI